MTKEADQEDEVGQHAPRSVDRDHPVKQASVEGLVQVLAKIGQMRVEVVAHFELLLVAQVDAGVKGAAGDHGHQGDDRSGEVDQRGRRQLSHGNSGKKVEVATRRGTILKDP